MKQSNTSKYAYLAGAIDSDGCIEITKGQKNDRPNPTYRIRLRVNQFDGRMVDYLYGAFGGFLITSYNKLRKKNYYTWQIECNKAYYILNRLIPFLRIKKKQAEIAVRFQQHINKRKENTRRGIELSKKELELREQLFQDIRKEKHIYIPCAVVETKRSESSKKKICDSPNIKE